MNTIKCGICSSLKTRRTNGEQTLLICAHCDTAGRDVISDLGIPEMEQQMRVTRQNNDDGKGQE